MCKTSCLEAPSSLTEVDENILKVDFEQFTAEQYFDIYTRFKREFILNI